MKSGLTRQERFSRQSEFLELLRHGRVKMIDGVLVYVKPASFWSLGISISKKAGGAVKRNRIKRVLREIYRTSRENVSKPFAVLFLVKKPVFRLNFHSFQLKYINWLHESSKNQSTNPS